MGKVELFSLDDLVRGECDQFIAFIRNFFIFKPIIKFKVQEENSGISISLHVKNTLYTKERHCFLSLDDEPGTLTLKIDGVEKDKFSVEKQ